MMVEGRAEAGFLVDRLQAAYNKIDHHLRATIGHRRRVPFAALIDQCVVLTDADRKLLTLTARVRNLLVHELTRPNQYPVAPSASIVERLELLARRLGDPDRAIPTFRKKVEQLRSTDSLAVALKRIRQRAYSQFPVYDGPSFRGLLTENGVTRWLARHVATELSLVELDEVEVKTVLAHEEDPRTNWFFVGGDTFVDRVRQLFGEGDMLEAVLITEHGRQNEDLIGIATRWDMLNWRRGRRSA